MSREFPATQGKLNAAFEISVSTAAGMSVALKNVAYRDIYAELEKARCFNVKMIDGALVSLRYRFLAGAICEHSLSYFPSPDLEHFQNEPEIYLEDEVFADVVAKNIVPSRSVSTLATTRKWLRTFTIRIPPDTRPIQELPDTSLLSTRTTCFWWLHLEELLQHGVPQILPPNFQPASWDSQTRSPRRNERFRMLSVACD